jgi:hypothetical protein
VRDRVEVAFQVGVHHVGIALRQQALDSRQGLLTTAAGPEAKTLARKIAFENRLQHHPQRGLHHPVADRRDAQRSLLRGARLRDHHPSHRLRHVAVLAQLLREFLDSLLCGPGKHSDRFTVHTARSAVGLHLFPSRPQRAHCIDLVDQTVPDSVLRPSFKGFQHPFRPDASFHPWPAAMDFSAGPIPSGNWRRALLFVTSVLHGFSFLRSFAPRSLPASPLL